jgi:dihydroflavonol-4-reductase
MSFSIAAFIICDKSVLSARLIAPFFEVYYNLKKQTPLFTKYSLYTLSSNANFSNEKAKEKLGFKNRNMKETIKDTVEWINKK